MGARQDHANAGEPRLRGHVGTKNTQVSSGVGQRPKHPPRQAETIEHGKRPVARLRVVALGRRGVGPFVGSLAGEKPVKEIGDHQHAVGRRQHARVRSLEGKELVEGVDLHELQAGGREDVGPRHHLFRSREHPASAGVAVADGIGQQGVVRPKKREVDAPGINADGRNRCAVAGRRRPQAADNFVPEAGQIPDELARHGHGAVLEPVEFLQLEDPAVEAARDDTAAGGSQIDRQSHVACHTPSFSRVDISPLRWRLCCFEGGWRGAAAEAGKPRQTLRLAWTETRRRPSTWPIQKIEVEFIP